MSGHLDQHTLVWQGAIATASKVYTATAQMDSRYADLQERMRSAALQLATNLAQVCMQSKRLQRIALLNAATGTLAELETQLHVAIELGILDPKLSLVSQVARLRMLTASAIRSLQEQRSLDTRIPWQVSPRAMASPTKMIDQKPL